MCSLARAPLHPNLRAPPSVPRYYQEHVQHKQSIKKTVCVRVRTAGGGGGAAFTLPPRGSAPAPFSLAVGGGSSHRSGFLTHFSSFAAWSKIAFATSTLDLEQTFSTETHDRVSATLQQVDVLESSQQPAASSEPEESSQQPAPSSQHRASSEQRAASSQPAACSLQMRCVVLYLGQTVRMHHLREVLVHDRGLLLHGRSDLRGRRSAIVPANKQSPYQEPSLEIILWRRETA